MQKKSIITLAGKPGSGKSTTSKLVAQKLNYKHFSSGDLFRALGKERGLDVMSTNLTAEQNSEVDELVDQKLRDIGLNEDKRVVDSRTAWHWMPQSFKVFLDLDFVVASERIIKNMDSSRLSDEKIPDDPQLYADILKQRLESENRRYKKLYDINPLNLNNYDLIVDTKKNSPEQAAELIVATFNQWRKS